MTKMPQEKMIAGTSWFTVKFPAASWQVQLVPATIFSWDIATVSSCAHAQSILLPSTYPSRHWYQLPWVSAWLPNKLAP